MSWVEIMTEATSGSSDPPAFLRRAGKEAMRRKAARQPNMMGESLPAPPLGSASDCEPMGSLIRYSIENCPQVLEEFASVLAARHLDLPWTCLPDVLGRLRQMPPQIANLIGPKGLWLAGLNPSWSKALAKGLPMPPSQAAEWFSLDPSVREQRLKGMMDDDLAKFVRFVRSERDWSPDFTDWILESVRKNLHRASPVADTWKALAPEVAASVHPSRFEDADRLLAESHASPRHPVLKSWFPILAVRRKLHQFIQSLPS